MPRCQNVFTLSGATCVDDATVMIEYGTEFGRGREYASVVVGYGPTLRANVCEECAMAFAKIARSSKAPIYLEPIKEAGR
jgi:hypothetical protein